MIRFKAKLAGLSISAYLRESALSSKIVARRSVELRADFADHVRELAKVNSDQARLGNLLKLWISKGFSQIPYAQINELMQELLQAQAFLKETAKKLSEEQV